MDEMYVDFVETFHFDVDIHQPELAALKNKLERRVLQLNGVRVQGFLVMFMIADWLAESRRFLL